MPTYVTFTEGEEEFPYLQAAKQKPLSKRHNMATQITIKDKYNEANQMTTTTLASEFDAKVSEMKKSFNAQQAAIMEQNNKQQQENDKCTKTNVPRTCWN